MYCTKCGKEIKEDARFCIYCGEVVSDSAKKMIQPDVVKSPQPVTPPKQKEQRGKWKIAVFALVGIVLVGGMAVIGVLLHNKSNDTEPVMVEDVKEDEIETTEKSEIEQETDSEISKDELISQETQTEASDDVGNLTKDDCQELVENLHTKEVCDTEQKETLTQMTCVAVESKICDSEGVLFADMPDRKKNALNYAIIWAGQLDGIFNGQLEMLDDWKYPIKDAESLFYDIYGCNEIPYVETPMIKREENTVCIEPAGGDPWLILYSGDVREMDQYYLFSGPYFFGYNGGDNDVFQGYIDVLFVKNETSRFGVTMVYAKTDSKGKEIAMVDTSSKLKAQDGKNYSGNNLIDGNPETAWVEGVDGVGEGETITLHMKEKTEVHGVAISNGYLASSDLYLKNGRIKRVKIDAGNGITLQKDIPESDICQFDSDEIKLASFVEFEQPVTTDTIIITILEAEPGEKYDDTCISEIEVY